MLVLTRRVGEVIMIAGNIRVTVLTVKGRATRLGISSPVSVPIVRGELLARSSEGARSPTSGDPTVSGVEARSDRIGGVKPEGPGTGPRALALLRRSREARLRGRRRSGRCQPTR